MYGTDYSRGDNMGQTATTTRRRPRPRRCRHKNRRATSLSTRPSVTRRSRELLHEIDDGRRPIEAARDRGDRVGRGGARASLDRGERPSTMGYSRWDNIKDSDDDATGSSSWRTSPTSRCTGRTKLMMGAPRAASSGSTRTQKMNLNLTCPFDRGSEPWFWFLLLANKPHITLQAAQAAPYHTGARGSSARSRASCARTASRPAASGSGRRCDGVLRVA